MWNSNVFDNAAPIIMNGAPGIYGNANSSYLPMQAIESFPQVLPQMQNIMIQPQQMEMMMPLQSRVIQLVQQPIIQIQAQQTFSPPPNSPPLLRSPTERKTPERAKVEPTVEKSERIVERAVAPASPQIAPKPERIPIYIEIPVEKIVEKRVPVEVEKIVIKEVMIPVEKIVKKIIEKENIIEVPIEVPIEVEVEKIVHKNRTIFEDRLVYQDRTGKSALLHYSRAAVELEVERVVTNKTYVTHEEYSPLRLREPSPPGSRKASYQGAMSPISGARRVSSPGLYVSNQPRTYRTGSPQLSPSLTSIPDQNY